MRPDRPGRAWVWSKKKKRWVRPRKPGAANMSYEWDDNKGWVATTEEEAAAAWGLALSVINSDESPCAENSSMWTTSAFTGTSEPYIFIVLAPERSFWPRVPIA